MGGDEFLVVVPSGRAAEALARLQGAIDRADPIQIPGDDDSIRVQVSLGASDFASAEELSYAIESADRAMYQEKTRRMADARLGPDSRTPLSTPVVRSL